MRLGTTSHPFYDCFNGFEKVQAVRKIFGLKTEDVLRNLKVDFTWLGGYMFVNGSNGHLVVNKRYLSLGNPLDVYLDVIHELVHIRQLHEGRELFDANYSYVHRPTELEAYRFAVDEAKRLGVSEERICEYLKTEWMTESDFNQLARALNVKCSA